MKRYIVDFRKVNNIKEAHSEMKKALDFPDYYGGNLDALNDALSELSTGSKVYILVGEEFYGLSGIMEVFNLSGIDNEFILTK